MNEDKNSLRDEELEQVVAGSFYDREHTWRSDYPHSLIVTALYYCPLFKGSEVNYFGIGNCCNCDYCVRDGIVLYCTKRTHDDDPVEHYFHGSDYAGGRF